jgi:DNA-binding NarL/FixJ family response regulator
MRRQFAPQSHTMDQGSFGTQRVRVIVIGGGVHRYSLRALVMQLLREALASDVPAPSDGPVRFSNPATGPLAQSSDDEDAPLSKREREVLVMLARGLPNKEIARLLFIADRTVKWHTQAIYRKLAVTNRTEAVGVALRRGLVALDAAGQLTGCAA